MKKENMHMQGVAVTAVSSSMDNAEILACLQPDPDSVFFLSFLIVNAEKEGLWWQTPLFCKSAGLSTTLWWTLSPAVLGAQP